MRRHWWGLPSRPVKAALILLSAFFTVTVVFFRSFPVNPYSCIIIDHGPFKLDTMCSDRTPHCYSVYVKNIVMNHEHPVSFVAISLERDGRPGISTALRLLPPEASFLISPISLNRMDRGKQVLSIGLAGGSVDMGLHEMKPYVNITSVEIDKLIVEVASKWFGVKDSKYHHTVVQDGVEFLEESAAQGRKFDLVIVDACDDSGCPAKSFKDLKVLRTMKKVLKPIGSLVIDVFPWRRSIGSAPWLKELSVVFPTCIAVEHAVENHMVVTCVPFRIEHRPRATRALNVRFTAIVSQLRLKDALHNYYVTFLDTEI